MHSVFTPVRRFGASCFLLAGALFAQALHAEEAERYNIAPQRFALLDQAMQAQIDQQKLAGIDLLVYQDGEVLHRKLTGYQELESRQPLAEDTLYKIFSLTKPITGTALLMLFEQGKFQLDDPVERYLPQFEGMQVAREDGPDGQPLTEPANHPITIRELMNHTAGFTYGRFSESQVDTLYVKKDIQNPDTTLADMVDKLARIPLRQQPGTLWHYSVSVDVQARLVEVLSGMAFDEFLERHIFEPLGMEDTGFYVPEEQAARLAFSYQPSEQGLVRQSNDFFLRSHRFLNGGGGLISSMDDYLRFARMLLNEGELDGVRILKAETVRMMASDQLPPEVEGPNWAPGNRFGLNVAVVNDSPAAQYLPEGTYWWWGIQGTWMWVDPANRIITLGMMQNTDYRHSRVVHGTVSNILYRPAGQ